MEETLRILGESLNALTNAVTGIKEDLKKNNDRLAALEQDRGHADTMVDQSQPLVRARTEYELKEISVLPDCVKELHVFDGQQEAYLSWVNRAQSILTDYELVKTRPLYRAIVLHIRQKIRGRADMALAAYGVQDDDWEDIKRTLALHYADKRDIRTLERELGEMSQGSRSLDSFYMDVNSHLSLILNNLKAGNYPREAVKALTETYRDKALDVFIQGVGGDCSKHLLVRGLKNLPEAYSFCIGLQNVRSKTSTPQFYQPSGSPRFAGPFQQQARGPFRPPFSPGSGRFSQNSYRSQGPRQAIKLESNQSGQSYQSGYSGRQGGDSGTKRASEGANPFRKAQRLYHVELAPLPPTPTTSEGNQALSHEVYYADASQVVAEANDYPPQEVAEGVTDSPQNLETQEEANFMTNASPVYRT